MKADAVFVNGNIWTGNPARPWAHAISVRFGRVAALDDDALQLPAAETVDLSGRTVVPGFYDAHHHLALRGQRLAALDVGFHAAPSRERLLEIIAGHARTLPADSWVRGGGFDQNKIGGFPTREEFDLAAGGRPVWITHVSEHMAVASTSALRAVGITDLANPPAMTGGVIELGEDGLATGLFLENAKKWFDSRLKPYSAEEIITSLEVGSRIALTEGITSIADPGVGAMNGIGMGPADLHAYQRAREQRRLHVRVTAMPYITATHAIAHFAPGTDGWGLDLGIRSGFGDERLSIGAVKVLSDGSLIGRSAALTCDYHDHADDGMLLFDPEELGSTLGSLHRSGWQLAVHAIGDRAVAHAVEHLHRAQQSNPPRVPPRHRIEHCGMASDESVRRIAALGIIPVPQGRFLSELGDGFIDVLGAERADRLVYRMKSFLDAGVELPGSSDTPVVEAHPLKGIHDMVNRRTAGGQPIGLHERVTVEQAFRAYTYGSAHASHQERTKGRLMPGLLADMAVLEANPFAAKPAELGDIAVRATVLGGEVVFGADSLG